MTDELVVCSLEAWDDVRRRNQLLAERLLERNPSLRMLFVEPPHDVLHARSAGDTGLRRVDERLWALRPRKVVPRRAGRWADRALLRQVLSAMRRLDFGSPTLWINDSTYATLARETSFPTLYDITDDWLLARAPARELDRRRRLEDDLLRRAGEVVVCSPALERSRSAARPVTLIPNGVDADHFRRPRARPNDLPPAPVAVYVGTLHDERVDVDLVEELARATRVALVGPDSLSEESRARLRAAGVSLLGPRAYADVPAYLQHADVIVVPHHVTPFTESLDPIKAYECAAVGRPTVATRIAGFNGLGVAREEFVAAVGRGGRVPAPLDEGATWEARAAAFEAALERAAE